jgi:flagellar basal body P-ring protein FlgI
MGESDRTYASALPTPAVNAFCSDLTFTNPVSSSWETTYLASFHGLFINSLFKISSVVGLYGEGDMAEMERWTREILNAMYQRAIHQGRKVGDREERWGMGR